jgi:hypothetical protein
MDGDTSLDNTEWQIRTGEHNHMAELGKEKMSIMSNGRPIHEGSTESILKHRDHGKEGKALQLQPSNGEGRGREGFPGSLLSISLEKLATGRGCNTMSRN